MQGSEHSANQKYDFASFLWVAALVACAASEALLVYTKLHKAAHDLLSLSFWYLPIMVVGPSATAMDIYRRISKIAAEGGRIVLPMWSYHLALLLFVANGTLFVVMVGLLTN